MPGYSRSLHWCIQALDRSPLGRLLLKDALRWDISLSDLPGQDYVIDPGRKIVLLDNHAMGPDMLWGSEFFRFDVLASLVRALRDIAHEERYGGFDDLHNPENILLLTRVREADLYAVGAFVGWELRTNGMPEFWRHMIGGADGDIAQAFAAHREKNPSQSFSHEALSNAFHQWFENTDRINECDHEALEYLDAVLRYAKAPNPFGSKRLGGEDVELLSCMPDRTTYLYKQGNRIARDPSFAGLDDEYNQTHFMQIMHDMQAVHVEGVAFRDTQLASLIFPSENIRAKSAAL